MELNLSADGNGPGTPLSHFWSVCVGAGRANEGLRAGWQEHLKTVAEHCGFRYCRFHGLFHDDMFVIRTVEGRQVYHWQYVDDLFDRMLESGVRPFVELGFCPQELASKEATTFWWKGHGVPPSDYQAWGDLVEALVRHCIARYGREEVRQWYFEVWNEPNLDFFFAGGKQQYFELYRISALRIKAVDPMLRVGGPSTSNFVPDDRFAGEHEDKSKGITNLVEDLGALKWRGVWIEDFLQYCEIQGLPLDFLSTHPYPTDFAIDKEAVVRGRSRPVDATRQDLQWLRAILAQSAYPDAQLHLTEWSSSPSHRDHTHDYLPAAAYVVKCNLESAGLADSLSYWTFTDIFEEHGAGTSAFHGGFGMQTIQGIVKPVFHAYRMMNLLGDEILAQARGGVVTRHRESGRLSALFYHYPEEYPLTVPMADTPDVAEAVQATGVPGGVSLLLRNARPGATFEVEALSLRNGCAREIWKAMGCPASPTREQTAALRRGAWSTDRFWTTASGDGTLRINAPLNPWGLLLIRELS